MKTVFRLLLVFILIFLSTLFVLPVTADNNTPIPPFWQSASEVSDIALSADGSCMLVGANQHAYFLENGALKWHYDAPSDGISMVQAVAISNDASLSVLGCGDGSIYLIDRLGTLLWRYTLDIEIVLDKEVRDPVESVAISSDNLYITACNTNAGVLMLDRQGKLLWKVSTQDTFGATCVALSADDSCLALGTYTHILLFDRSGKLLWKYAYFDIFDISITADASLIAAGSRYNNILLDRQGNLLWDTSISRSCGVAISADGALIITGSEFDNIYLLDKKGETQWTFNFDRSLFHIALSADGLSLAASGLDGTIYLISDPMAIADTAHEALAVKTILPPEMLWKYSAGTDVYDVAVSADGSCVVFGCGNGNAVFLEQGQLAWQYDSGAVGEGMTGVRSVALSPDASLTAIGCADGSVRLLDRDGHIIWKHEFGKFAAGNILGVAISADSSCIAAGSTFGVVYLLDRQGNLLWQYSTEAGDNVIGNNCGVALSADASYIVVGPCKDHVFLLNRQGKLLWKYGTKGYVYDAALTADGSYLAAGGNGNTVYYLDRQGKLQWKTPTGEVNSISVSADGLFIGVGSVDGNLYLLGKQGGILAKYYTQNWVDGVALTPNGKYIAASCFNGDIYLFTNNAGAAAAAAAVYGGNAGKSNANYTLLFIILGAYIGFWLLLFLLSRFTPLSKQLVFLKKYTWLYLPFVSWLLTIFPLVLPPLPLGPIQISLAWSRRRMFPFYDAMCQYLGRVEPKRGFPAGWLHNVGVNIGDLLTLGLAQLFSTASLLDEIIKKNAGSEHKKMSPSGLLIMWLFLGNVVFLAIYIVCPGYIFAPLLKRWEAYISKSAP
jgi:WD40 repeat protein